MRNSHLVHEKGSRLAALQARINRGLELRYKTEWSDISEHLHVSLAPFQGKMCVCVYVADQKGTWLTTAYPSADLSHEELYARAIAIAERRVQQIRENLK